MNTNTSNNDKPQVNSQIKPQIKPRIKTSTEPTVRQARPCSVLVF
jgi:hypothetical protein